MVNHQTPVRERVRLVTLIALLLLSGLVLRALAGPPMVPAGLPSAAQISAILGGASLPLDALASAVVTLAWLLWLWMVASLALELLLIGAEAVAQGATWVHGLRHVADRLSMPLARRAVAAAFALQVLSRAVPVAAAPLPDTDQAWIVDTDANPGPVQQIPAPVASYRVRAGDTLWSIAEAAYGSGSQYRQLVTANLGRPMTDGEPFSATGVIKPGWVLDIPEPSRWIQESDGGRWYTVAAGDTLSGIAGRVLGDPDRWAELFELNRDVATLDDGRMLDRPELIWPGLRLRLPGTTQTTIEADPSSVELTVAAASTLLEAPPPPINPIVADHDATNEATSQPDTDPVEEVAPPPLERDIHPMPPIDLEEAPAPTEDVPRAPEPEPTSPVVPAVAALSLVGAAGATAYGIRRLRRLRPLPQEPESEVVVEGGYAEAELTHDFARHLQGGTSFDPATALVRQVQHVVHDFNLHQVPVIALRHGRSSTTISFAAKLTEQQLLLDLAAQVGERLEAEAEAWVSSDQDVQLRIARVRKTRLLPPSNGTAETPPPWFVPLGVLYDRQVFSAAWPAMGHVLVASLPGRGADTILTSLLATLTAHRSPQELRVWVVARPRAFPAPIDELPHLDATMNPDDAEDRAGLVARVRTEIEQRALGGAWPELLIVVPELTSLGDEATQLQLLLGGAATLGVRLISGTTDPAQVTESPMLPSFTTRMVLQMPAEEASVALLGSADAAFLGGGGRLLLRLDGREPVELYGYQVAPEHLERLVRVMRSAYLTLPAAAAVAEPSTLDGDVGVDEATEFETALDLAPDEASDSTTRIAVLPAANDGPPLRVHCFGAPRAFYRGIQVWPKLSVGEAKPWELLLFIACQPVAGVSRVDLAHALWPDIGVDDDLLLHRVRQMRYRLRKSIGDDPEISDGICMERSGPPHLDPSLVWSDAQEFLLLMHEARTQPGTLSIPPLERARAIYTADLLLGPDTRRYAWVDERDDSGVTLREHFRRQLQHATLSLADLYSASDRIDDAIELYRELSEADPGEDRVWRALYQLHAARGDLPSLLREERRLRTILRDLAVRAGEEPQSLSTEPSRELQEEYQRLLATLERSRRTASAG